jgi:hypothetical protein
MAALKEDVKLFVVTALACFDTPEQVIAAVKQEYGVVVSKQQLGCYNPLLVAGRNLSAKLKKVFQETRESFMEKVSEIPIANQSYRLRAMNRLYLKAENQGNTAVAAQLLEQAAKETGGAFTNRREHTGAGGGPIEQRTAVVDDQAVKDAVARLEAEY